MDVFGEWMEDSGECTKDFMCIGHPLGSLGLREGFPEVPPKEENGVSAALGDGGSWGGLQFVPAPGRQ